MQIFICQIYEQIFWVNPHPDGAPVIILEEASFDNVNEEKF
jgi:hypothetical protein